MKDRKCNSRTLSSAQLVRVSMIVSEQWEEVMRVVQKRADQHHQQRLLLSRQVMQQVKQRRHAA